MRQTTIFEPTSEHDLICAIEQHGWRLVESEGGVTTWYRNGIERAIVDMAAWLAAGCPEQREPSVIEVEAAIRAHAPVTRMRLKRVLKRDYDVTDLAALLDEQVRDGWIEETAEGFVMVDRL